MTNELKDQQHLPQSNAAANNPSGPRSQFAKADHAILGFLRHPPLATMN
jgi:hypothetical protein